MLFALTLSACGGGGGDDSGGGENDADNGSGASDTSITASATPLNPPASNGATLSEGTTPVTADTGSNRFTVAGLLASSSYKVWVHDLTTDVALGTYFDSNYSISRCHSDEAGTSTEDCSATSDADGRFYIEISSPGSTSFLVTVLSAPVNEGSMASPVGLSVDTPYLGQVATGNSYYEISGLTPGDVYNITLTDILVDADLTVSMLKTFGATCESTTVGEADESCQVAANFEGKIYIKTDSNGFGAYYTLNASATGAREYIFEGYRDAPLDLTGALPYDGQVNRHDSYYMFTGLTPGVRYEVRINTTTVNTQIYLFDTADFVNVDCDLNYYGGSTPPASRLCVATAPASGNLYLQIPYYGTTGGSYEIDLGLAPVAEGSAGAPKEIQSTAIPYDGQVDTTYSYYVITGLQADYVYDLEFNNVTHHYARITVADDPNNLSGGCTSPCAIRSNSSGEIYVRVDGTSTDNENNDLGAWFTLNFGDAENSEGSMASPVAIPTDGSIYQGQVTEIPSYYRATGLNPNQYYLIYLTSDIYGGPSLYAYSDSAYSSWICSDYPYKACLAPANGSGEIFIKASYNSVYGARFEMWMHPSLLTSEGSSGAPVDISGSLATSGTPTVHSGKVSSYLNDNQSYYAVHGLPGTTNYTVSLTELTDDAYVEVFSDAGFTNKLCSAHHTGIQDEICVAQTTATGGSVKDVSLYIRVTLDKIRNSTSAIWDGASYTLMVSEGGNNIVSEGARGAPVDITASLPYAGEVREDEDSYYMITGLDPATPYAVLLEYDKGDLGFRILGDVNFTLTNYLCVSNDHSDFSEHCTATPNASGEMYILVEGNSYTDSSFSISMTAAPVAEGSPGAPLDISASLPYAGQVGIYQYTDDSTLSYYRVSGLVPGNAYLVTTGSTTQDAYTSVNGSDYCFNNGWAPAESCQATADSNGELALTVRAYEGAFFELNVRPAPSIEGSVNSPVVIAHQTPYQGSSDGSGSYYKVTGLVPYSSHRISLISQDDTQWVKVFSDGSYQHEVCYSSYDNHDIGCGASADSNGEIHFRVGYSPANYQLYVP